ncbi:MULTISPECIES: ATP-dependent Clp protease adaptor ClpS [unclassified Mameliella]|uniref:ATP-dependent Clp protease adaptor ClpS n=1 Tax=unclassified Mameliella TaxID=2630630 RepID=UPI00273FA760|nr:MULTISPECIES: ATP-dependent Clp protease adaptor ClpS [unclassified Mameliella]
MRGFAVPRRAENKTATERPKLYKVILLKDDVTPRDFVVEVLKGIFRMTEAEVSGPC